MSAWAAAEVFRADPAAAGARQYVERFYPMGWADAALETDHWDTQAAFTYCRTPTADPAVLANMRAALARYVTRFLARMICIGTAFRTRNITGGPTAFGRSAGFR